MLTMVSLKEASLSNNSNKNYYICFYIYRYYNL